ncbi:hypothetical protein [Paraburkholderia tropica]|uniref:hypothetical protein n=1 Tax=Paraburkholderia tropica TaxID=92647 RepID=UPI002AB7190D|nr:hypothetical protein [Paraburkholderia tropica]
MKNAIEENGHEFVTGESLGFGSGSALHSLYCCKQCGFVRRKDGQNKPCKGVVKVELRSKGFAAHSTDHIDSTTT